MRAKILPTALFAALTLTAITSVRAEEATFEVTWLGENDKSWTDSGVWDSATPKAWQTAIINHSSLIKFKAGNGETVVSNVVVGANVSPTFQRADSATTGQHLLVQEMNGDGTLKLNRVGIHADYSNYDTCNISVAKIEAVANGNNDSWFDGGSASGKRMVVNSDITVNGFLKVYKQTTLAGETTLAGKLLMVDEAVVVNNLVYAGDDATIDSASKGSVGRLTVRSGTLSPSTLPTGVTVGSLVLDGGTVSVGDGTALPTSGLSLGVLSGGYIALTISDADFAAGVTPAYPSGLTFAADADLSNVFAIVKNNSGDTQKAYAITKTGDAYSFAELMPTDTVKWIGGIDNNWATAGNWIYGAVPTEGQMVVFDNNARVIIGADVTADITITSGSRVSFRSSDTGYVHPSIFATTVTGGGRVALEHVGLRAISNKNSTVDVSELEIVNCGSDSWLQGVDENNPLTVSSAIVSNGKLCVYSYVLFNGDNSKFAGNWEMGNQWGATGRARFASGNSGFPACSSSACYGDSRIYLDTDEEVVFASLTLPSGNDRIFVTVPDATLTACAESNDIELSGNVVLQGEGSSLTVRKIGPGTLKTGLAGVYSLNVEQGRAEFCADNSGISVSVSSCASIGSTADVTIGAVTFENGAKVMQTVTKTADEVEEGTDQTYTYAMPTLTLTGDYDISGVLFGVTNPEDLPAVTKTSLADLPRFTMFAANSLSGAVATENGGYTPEGSVKNGRWIARPSRTAANAVEFRPYISGLAVIIK